MGVPHLIGKEFFFFLLTKVIFFFCHDSVLSNFWFFETESHYLAQTHLELVIVLP